MKPSPAHASYSFATPRGQLLLTDGALGIAWIGAAGVDAGFVEVLFPALVVTRVVLDAVLLLNVRVRLDVVVDCLALVEVRITPPGVLLERVLVDLVNINDDLV